MTAAMWGLVPLHDRCHVRSCGGDMTPATWGLVLLHDWCHVGSYMTGVMWGLVEAI